LRTDRGTWEYRPEEKPCHRCRHRRQAREGSPREIPRAPGHRRWPFGRVSAAPGPSLRGRGKAGCRTGSSLRAGHNVRAQNRRNHAVAVVLIWESRRGDTPQRGRDADPAYRLGAGPPLLGSDPAPFPILAGASIASRLPICQTLPQSKQDLPKSGASGPATKKSSLRTGPRARGIRAGLPKSEGPERAALLKYHRGERGGCPANRARSSPRVPASWT
jgi:hypothetical protein